MLRLRSSAAAGGRASSPSVRSTWCGPSASGGKQPMAFLRSSTGHDSAVTLRGRGVWLRAPLMGDYGPWAELRAMSRDHLTPWEPVWQRDELSRSSFRRRVRHYQREAREDLGYAFLIFS